MDTSLPGVTFPAEFSARSMRVVIGIAFLALIPIITQLAAKIPIGTAINHGENRKHTNAPTEQVWHDYQAFLAKAHPKRTIVKRGELLPDSRRSCEFRWRTDPKAAAPEPGKRIVVARLITVPCRHNRKCLLARRSAVSCAFWILAI